MSCMTRCSPCVATTATPAASLSVPCGGWRLSCASIFGSAGVRRRRGGAGARALAALVVVAAERAGEQQDEDDERDGQAAEQDRPADARGLLRLAAVLGAGAERVEGLVDLGRLGGDLGQVVAGERAQLARDDARPGAAVGGRLEELAGGLPLGGGLLAEQEVGDVVLALEREVVRSSGPRASRAERARSRTAEGSIRSIPAMSS